jgi:hypothetical protein
VNPTAPVPAAPGLRVAAPRDGDRRPRDGDAQAFRRALQEKQQQQQEQKPAPGAAPAAEPPAPSASALKAGTPGSRRDQSVTARHVDVVA